MTTSHPGDGDWVARFEGTLSPPDAAALDAHAAACAPCAREREALRAGLALLRTEARGLGAAPHAPPPSAGGGRGAAWRPRMLAAAALVALATGAAFLLLRPAAMPAPAGEVAWARGGTRAAGSPVARGDVVETAAGERIGARLDSGAEVSWNAATRVRVESGTGVALLSGEIHVRVPPAARGFAVTTPHGRLVDLGTAFLVRADAARTTATVLKGSIRAETPGVSRVVAAGERAALWPRLDTGPVDAAGIDRSAGWIRGALFSEPLRGVPVPDVLDRLEAASAFRFEFDRAAAARATVTASLRGTSSEAILDSLLRAVAWRTERDGWTVRIHVPPERR